MKILGIDIGGSGIKGAPVRLKKGVLAEERYRIPTPQPSTPEAVAETVAQIVDHFRWKGPVGCTFPAIVKKNVIYSAANVDKAWIGVDGGKLLGEKIGCPVLVINDADAAGLAEMRYGAGRGRKGDRGQDAKSEAAHSDHGVRLTKRSPPAAAGPATHADDGRLPDGAEPGAPYRPRNSGSRFSMKAMTASMVSFGDDLTRYEVRWIILAVILLLIRTPLVTQQPPNQDNHKDGGQDHRGNIADQRDAGHDREEIAGY